MPIDPVCGVRIGEDEALTARFRGQTYYFCCSDCKGEFLESPEDYASEEIGRQFGEEV